MSDRQVKGAVFRIAAVLKSNRFSLENEKTLQAEIADAFDSDGIEYQREAKVQGGVIDFKCGCVGVEVKIGGSKRAIFHQLQRYAEDETLDVLILATNIAMGMPERINGKPVMVVSLGSAWL